MKVIGAGWGRTGTTSLAAALPQLGVEPCLHMRQMWEHPQLAERFASYLDGRPVDWATELASWNATVDWPGCFLWEELAERWPDAIVLLSVRDPDEWYSSVRATIHEWTTPGRDVGPAAMRALMDGLWEKEFGSWEAVFDRDHAISCFLEHNEAVRRRCEPGRLLEWTVRDGWAPLCAALGLVEPSEPFPHLNSRSN